MKRTLLFGMLICSAFAFNACNDEEKIYPAPADPVYIDTVLTYSVSMPQNDSYAAVAQLIDSVAICNLFGITYDEFWEYLEDGTIGYYAIAPDSTIDETPATANGYGHWFDANGNVCTWASGSGALYSEMQATEGGYSNNAFQFNIGQYPEVTVVGDTYRIGQGFLYEPGDDYYLAINFFDITITAK